MVRNGYTSTSSIGPKPSFLLFLAFAAWVSTSVLNQTGLNFFSKKKPETVTHTGWKSPFLTEGVPMPAKQATEMNFNRQQSFCRNRNGQQGFTLIELLVVIAIIAVLIGL